MLSSRAVNTKVTPKMATYLFIPGTLEFFQGQKLACSLILSKSDKSFLLRLYYGVGCAMFNVKTCVLSCLDII